MLRRGVGLLEVKKMRGSSAIHERVLYYAHAEKDRLYADFRISEDGYGREEAESSRQKYGSNRLAGRAKDTVLYRLRRAFINPFTIILFVLAIISFVTDVLLASDLAVI